MLINLSNHPSARWSDEQLAAAAPFGEVVDLPFPKVDAHADEAYIAALADDYADKVIQLAENHHATVHLMGEMTLTFALLKRLQLRHIQCVASTTERLVTEFEPGHKESTFRFVKFRIYE